MSKALGNEKISLSEEDFKVKKFKAAPGGTYRIRISNKSKLKPGKNGGTTLELHGTITKGPHKKITFIDNIGSSVAWKIGQLLAAIGKKKVKEITLAKLLKLALEAGEFRALLKATKYEGKDRNEVVQYLPLGNGSEHDEDADSDDSDEDADDENDSSSDDDDDDDESSSDDDSDDDDDDDSSSDDDDDHDSSSDDDDDDDEPKSKKDKKGKKGKEKVKDKKKGKGKKK